MVALDEVVARIRAKIERSRALSINEQNTKAALIDPILRATGWDIEDWEEVQREFKVQSGDNPVDYALMDRNTRTPLVLLEAKALAENLDDRRWAGQIMGYAHVAGVKWVVLTNGDEYRIYNAYAEGPVEQKVFRTCWVSNESSSPEVTLALLTKEQVEKNEIDAIWKSQSVDQKVRTAVEDLFLPEPDASVVNLIKRRIPGLDRR